MTIISYCILDFCYLLAPTNVHFHTYTNIATMYHWHIIVITDKFHQGSSNFHSLLAKAHVCTPSVCAARVTSWVPRNVRLAISSSCARAGAGQPSSAQKTGTPSWRRPLRARLTGSSQVLASCNYGDGLKHKQILKLKQMEDYNLRGG